MTDDCESPCIDHARLVQMMLIKAFCCKFTVTPVFYMFATLATPASTSSSSHPSSSWTSVFCQWFMHDFDLLCPHPQRVRPAKLGPSGVLKHNQKDTNSKGQAGWSTFHCTPRNSLFATFSWVCCTVGSVAW